MSEASDSSAYCRACGEEIHLEAEICPECGVRQRPQPQQKNPGIAAIASFFVPGLGQIYNGQIGFGIVMGIVTFGLVIRIVGIVLAIPIWIYLVYHAYRKAEEINQSGSRGTPNSGCSKDLPAGRYDVQRVL